MKKYVKIPSIVQSQETTSNKNDSIFVHDFSSYIQQIVFNLTFFIVDAI